MAAGLGDGKDIIPNVPVCPTDHFPQQVPPPLGVQGRGRLQQQAAAVMLVSGGNTFPDVPDSLASTASFNKVNFLEYRAEDNVSEDCLAAAMLTDTGPFLGVVGSTLQDPKERQDRMEADLPSWLPLSSSETSNESSAELAEETSEESPRKDLLMGPAQCPLLSSLKIPLPNALARSPAAPQPHPPSVAQLVEGALCRQHWVVLTCLLLPLGVISCRVVPR